MSEKEVFEYTYSAPEQAEIRRIREKYLPKEESENKLEQLRKLDKSVEVPGMTVALTLGIMGTLIFGAGLSIALVWQNYVISIVLGLIGLAAAAMALPVYRQITERRRRKLAPQILRLTEELQNK